MSDKRVDVLRAEAEAIGLTGSDIAQYVISQQNAAREERAKEREAEKEKVDRGERARKEIADREKEKADREERIKEREHELELARLNATAASSKVQVGIQGDSVLRPRLSLFKDGEDITSYFIRFERIASLLGIKDDQYAIILGGLLTGKAVDIYTSLPPNVTSDYQLLKKALLRGYSKTPASYRSDFRNAKIKAGETYNQFSIHLGRLFDFWVDACNVSKDYNSLRDFMLYDQLMSSVPPDLRVYVKEQNVSTLTEAVTLADNWASAHNSYPKTNSGDKGKRVVETKAATPGPSAPKRDLTKVKCHQCGEMGHYKSHCPKNPAAFKQYSSSLQEHKVGFCFDTKESKKYVTAGTVNGAWVSTILRDTGCSCVIVSDNVLPDADIDRAEKVRVTDYLDRVDIFPKIKCYIRCP